MYRDKTVGYLVRIKKKKKKKKKKIKKKKILRLFLKRREHSIFLSQEKQTKT